jgi:hypothetical protein
MAEAREVRKQAGGWLVPTLAHPSV